MKNNLSGGDRWQRRRPRFFDCLVGFAALLVLAGAAFPASAQEAARASIVSLDTGAFPEVQIYLDLHAADGTFVSGVETTQVTVFENNAPLPPTGLQQMRTGVQFVTAITLGPAFGARDGLGVSRYEYLVQGIQGWQWKASNPDDFSLLISNGPELIHNSSPETWLQTLAGYEPQARQETPNLQVLSRALDVAADDPPQPGMDRMVLFITPPLGVEASVGLQSLAERARQEGTQINVWMVAAPDLRESMQADMLGDLAAQTSGDFFFFSGTETVPDLETYLEPRRAIYSLRYTSAITTTGAFPVRVEVELAGTSLVTSDKLVQFNVRAPNLVFLAAPVEILRTLAGTAPNSPALQTTITPLVELLVPKEQMLQLLVEFPDGRVRDIQRSALYVNGVLQEEHTQPPFDQFILNLEQITQTQQIVLRAEVTDALGLTGSTVEFPVQVTVELPKQSILESLSPRSLILIGASVGMAGLVLALVLVIGGRIRPHVFGRPEGQRASLSQSPTRPVASNIPTKPSGKKTAAARQIDPVTQPVNIPQAGKAGRRWGLPNQLSLPVVSAFKRTPSRRAHQPCILFLEPLPNNDEAPPSPPLPMDTDEILIGRSVIKATLVLNDPSIEEVHAIMKREGESFRLQDAGSTAGTWVNFTPIPKEGVLLQHGDMIHVGQVGFRFTQRIPGRTRKPIVTPLAPTDTL